jgi:hypothetical protein
MSRRTRRSGASRALRFALAIAAALALSTAATGPILAAGTEWGTPSASSQYGVTVGFTQPVTLPTDTTRVEMLLTVPGVDGPFVTEVVPESLGRPTTLDYAYDAASSQLYPNTRLEGRWRVTRADGTVEVGPVASVTYTDTTHDWRTKTGEVVRLHWYEGDDRFAERALAVGEKGLAKASEFLGVTESEPVDLFIYATRDDFMAAFGSGSQEWAGAFALPETRTLIADIPPDEIDTELVSLYVPHELAHVVFDTATANPLHEPPRWLNEGLAVYLTEGYASNWRSSLRDGVAEGTLLPLGAIANVFPTSSDGADLAYAESVSAVSHMVDRYGKDALVRLVRAYADGVSDDEAFTAGLGVTVAGFEADWLESIGASPPERQGPQPAPPGPVPSAWLVASPAPTTPGATGAPSEPTSPGTTEPVTPPVPSVPPSGGGTGDGQSGMPLLVVTLAAVVGVGAATLVFFARSRRARAPIPTGAEPSPPPGAPEAGGGPSASPTAPGAGSAGASPEALVAPPTGMDAAPAPPASAPYVAGAATQRPIVWAPAADPERPPASGPPPADGGQEPVP